MARPSPESSATELPQGSRDSAQTDFLAKNNDPTPLDLENFSFQQMKGTIAATVNQNKRFVKHHPLTRLRFSQSIVDAH
jgi:hypothetical protein